MGIAATSEASELCFHVLAHVPIDGPGNTFDPRYLDWLARRGDEPREDRARMREDGELLAAALAAEPQRELVHRLPELYRDETPWRRALAELDADDVADPATLAAMQRSEGAAFELAHAMLGLAHPHHHLRWVTELAPALAQVRDALARLLAGAGPLSSSLLAQRIELSWALGPRGRAFERRIVVGAPASWHDGELAGSAVIALHEHFVRDRGGDASGWAEREWAALCGLAQAIVGEAPVLVHAHARWLAGLDLRSLLEAVAAAAAIPPTLAARLADAPHDRAALLRSAARPC